MKSPFKIAGWCGLISLVLSILSFFLSSSSGAGTFALILSVISGVSGLFFVYGFIVFGKKFKNNLLLVMAWIGFVLAIIFLILTALGWGEKISNLADVTSSEVDASMLIIVWLAATVVFGVYSILFGVGLLRIGKEVQYAKASGILSIVAGASYIIFIGFFVQLAAVILEIILFFKAGKKFE